MTVYRKEFTKTTFTVTHTLQYLYTALTTGRNVTAVGLVDGEQFVSYNSNIKKLIPKTEWIKKVEADDQHFTKCVSAVRSEASLFQKHSSSPEVVCHATGFFPKAVMISWQKDGEEVHENVELRETLPNQDGSFQKRSILTVPAEELQKHTYTCVIQHSSLEKELVLPVSERRILRGGGSDGGSDGGQKCVIAAIVVVPMVLFAVAAGFVIWKKRKSGERKKETKNKFSRATGDIELELGSCHMDRDVRKELG
ncbi:class I histocompatibility antigen, Gogo-A*0201 alpha chain-like [Pangasianodon hypophthalmus]|uniref:class I histocompatibility antigen, Gogo-A*0201 alpha chain-like n=1 Tax=Pangasianodon hypophthalmus TaxID=310915 RepID=UPI00230700A4|nr:class I histocompatibility antigen, Gogo-A*0201 alpha chain-like [Pangasianodon hypophthalmus]